MISKTFFPIICLMFTLGLASQTFAENNDNEKHIVVNDTKTYKDTEITLEYLLVDQDKITLQVQLHGEKVKDLIIKKKGDVYMHTPPTVTVSDNQGQPLRPGAKKEDEPDKGEFIEGRTHNLSDDAIEFIGYFKIQDELPEFVTVKVMELYKGNKQKNNSPIAEFKIAL